MCKTKYALVRCFMKTIGQASDGIRLCYQEGLTSGKMLDYIYRNQPSGRWLIGPAIDRAFLNDSGWVAVRTRRKNLEKLMVASIEDLRKAKRSVQLLDIASGPADYILSVLEQVKGTDVQALCQDFEPRWVEEARQKAIARKITNVRFQQGDAFDREALRKLSPRPNLVVSSGFYDWFTDDNKVVTSLKIVFEILESGGYFVLSNQMAHPKLEFTQAVFEDFNHKPLQMTMRSREKVSQWLNEAGFKIEEILADDQGYYSVFKAVKS